MNESVMKLIESEEHRFSEENVGFPSDFAWVFSNMKKEKMVLEYGEGKNNC